MTAINGLALVTGAGRGGGLEVGHQLARRGYDLVITDTDDEVHVAAAGMSVYGTEVEAVRVDLDRAAHAGMLHSLIGGNARPFTVAALNMPVPSDTSIDEALDTVDRTVRTHIGLARMTLAHMIARRRGRLLLTATMTGSVSALGLAAHAACTALLASFAETTRDGLREFGIGIVATMPEPSHDPAAVVRAGLEALMRDDTPPLNAWAASSAAASLAGWLMPKNIRLAVQHAIPAFLAQP